MWLFRLSFAPVKIVLFVARTLGYSRFGLFLLGIAVGLLVAPTTGAELRDRLRQQVEARAGGAGDPPVVASDLGRGAQL